VWGFLTIELYSRIAERFGDESSITRAMGLFGLGIVFGGLFVGSWLGDRKNQKRTIVSWVLVTLVYALAVDGWIVIREATQLSWARSAPELLRNAVTIIDRRHAAEQGDVTCGEGTVLIIDRSNARLDESFFDLPRVLRPSSKAEVRVVAVVARSRQAVGEYLVTSPGSSRLTGSKAFRQLAIVTVVDINRGTVLAGSTIAGSEPPAKKAGYGDAVGSIPVREIAEYLTPLLRRNCPSGGSP
jgi:hypothetical protein